MSRTVRRKTGKIPFWVGTECIYVDGIFVYHKLEDKLYKKDMSIYHSDSGYSSGPSKWFRVNEHRKYRMQAGMELIRYYKDVDHEVQIRGNPRLDYWD